VTDFRTVGERLRNWGRWGDDDERGTVNLITPERLAAAGRLIHKGRIFDLGIDLDGTGPQNGRFRINPVHLMSETGAEQVFPGGFRYADGFLFMPVQASSQWDALAHVYYDGLLYNGHPAEETTVKGAARCGIDKQGKGIAGRGVLLDIPAVRGVPWLEAGEVITPADLDAAVSAQGGVAVGPGDILLVRTGWRRKFLEQGQDAGFMAGEPGLGLASCEWLHERDVAAVCADNWAVEALPGEDPDAFLAVHMVLIRDMGLTLGEILDFEELAEDCRADGRWEFFFAAPPLKITRAAGSPINPLAIK